MENKLNYLKLEIYIPIEILEKMRIALADVGAGHIGRYDCCLSYSRVKSTWRPLVGTSPYKGEIGTISEEDEYKIEVVIQRNRLEETLMAIKAVHPYEEPVINVIPLYGVGISELQG